MSSRTIFTALAMLVVTASSIAIFASARRPVAEYVINLDLAPNQRYQQLIKTHPEFNATVWKFYNEFFANDAILTGVLYDIVDKRGPEGAEQQGEIEGLADASGLPLKFVQGVQYLYELQTLMIPIENFTKPVLTPESYAKYGAGLARIPWRGPGCTGIIATCADGTVAHARNLDFSPVPIMTHLVYTGVFTRNGQEVFRSQMVAGYTMLITGMRKGVDGYTIERNTRYPDGVNGNEEMLKNILGGRSLNGWTLRKIMEEHADYDSAITAIAAAPFVSTEYSIVSGVKKGSILSKDPDHVAFVQRLGQSNFEERSDYIIITNFDFFFHDIREYFDPTGGKVGFPRRIAAQQILNATAPDQLTEEALFETINHKYVIADTIFQAVLNVEKGVWNVSQPDL